jgi:alkylation response protein AidB-like acyl-CoA dehydrogenase
MPIELTAHTNAGARLVAIAEELSTKLAARAAEYDRDGSYPDLTRPGTVATRTESGWRIDGRKMFCTMPRTRPFRRRRLRQRQRARSCLPRR